MGLLSAIFGGGSKSTSTSTTTSNVTVNPSTYVGVENNVDLAPVQNIVDHLAGVQTQTLQVQQQLVKNINDTAIWNLIFGGISLYALMRGKH